jgi:Arc/MetJ family transcription regulator
MDENVAARPQSRGDAGRQKPEGCAIVGHTSVDERKGRLLSGSPLGRRISDAGTPASVVCFLLLPGGVPMPLRKTAIAVPDDLLAAVDRAARERHESRNRFVTSVLRHAVRARRDAEITRRLNELFATPALGKQHSREASELDDVGTDWSDERW